MTRSSLFTLAYAVVLGAAGPLAACAGNRDAAANSQSALAASNLSETQRASTYSDAQIQAFVAARTEIQQLTPGQTAEEQAANQRRITDILQRHNINGVTYNAIETATRTDQALANRVAAASVGSSFTDAQLQAFVAASAEIDPLNRELASATPERRTQIAAEIRSALDRNNIDLQTYNGIAARAQADQTLGARIAQLRAAQTRPSDG